MLPSPTNSDQESTTSFLNVQSVGTGSLIRIKKPALTGLESYIREGVKAMNGRGVEVGGVILGLDLDWDSVELLITGFTSVNVEYKSGPAYRPEKLDLAAFREAAENPNGKLIGYFRSQVRGGLSIRAEDRRLLAQLFPESNCCFILIRTGAHLPSSAEIYRVHSGTSPILVGRCSLKGSDLDGAAAPKSLAPPHRLQIHRAASAELVNSTVILPVPENLQIHKNKGRIWAVAGVLAVLTILGVSYTLGKRSVPAPKTLPAQHAPKAAGLTGDSRIGLNIAEHGTQLEIHWNPSHPAIRTAVRGTLIITDGPAGDIRLTVAQLRSGLYVYNPATRTVHVLFMIYQDDGSFIGDMQDFASKLPRLESRQPDPFPGPSVSPRPQPVASKKSKHGRHVRKRNKR